MIAPTLAGDHYADTVLPGGDAISSIVNQWLSIGGKQYFATSGFIGSKNTNFASSMASKEASIVAAIEKTVADFQE